MAKFDRGLYIFIVTRLLDRKTKNGIKAEEALKDERVRLLSDFKMSGYYAKMLQWKNVSECFTVRREENRSAHGSVNM